ncbi:MAG: glutamate--tRNA ligase [Endomicrobiales bacterium]|nr:glutamate--tRNA ligase [Endomicrobiales bacterium]
MSVRVRFAPSPTGYLHIGGARTALYNWLFARQKKGTFILRIEDTDEARSTDESVGAILESMKWLGLDWDEGPEIQSRNTKLETRSKGSFGPYFQMEANERGIYKKYAEKLVSEGRAYKCYCTPGEVDEMRKKAQAEKKVPKYDGRCRELTAEQRKIKEAEGRKAVVRLKVPSEGKIAVDDVIRGRVEFDNSMLDDFVIIKASGVPTYNFAVVIDDVRMKISHVIRGDDHLSNTPKQMHIYDALGWRAPVFAHISMILGADGARLSKRHGHTSVLEYKADGYLPEALVNYLALLGWSTEDSQQLFGKDELVSKFSLERCVPNAAVFDPKKLEWMNGEYMRKIEPSKLPDAFYKWAEETGSGDKVKGWDRALASKIIEMEREKFRLFSEVPGLIDFFFADSVEYKPEAVDKTLKAPTAKVVIEESAKKLKEHDDFSAEGLEKFARGLAAEKGLGTGKVFHPIRVAISGKTTGPSLFHMMEILGKDKVIARLEECLKKCF